MKLYGSLTSPYVRRIRFLALELGIPVSLVDTMTEEGQKELRSKNPIWKVPYIEIGETKIWDSHAIMDYIFEKYGYGSLRPQTFGSHIEESNLIYAIDGALDAGINLFYLLKEGVPLESTPYLQKQKDRISSVMLYLKSELKDDFFFSEKRLGVSELNFYTALDWFRFRNVFPVAEHPELVHFLTTHGQNPNLEKTAPPK